MSRPSQLPVCAALGLALVAATGLRGQGIDRGLERLRSRDPFERERGEVEIRRIGTEALTRLARETESPDRLYRFRAERLFIEALSVLAAELENEHQALEIERNELEIFRRRDEAARLEAELQPRLEAGKAADPAFSERLEDLVEAARLELQENRAAGGAAPPLDSTRKERLSQLREKRKKHLQAMPSLEETVRLLVLRAQLTGAGSVTELSELERLRVKDLEERVAEREPRLAELLERLAGLGLPAWGGILARGLETTEPAASFHEEIVAAGLAKLGDQLLPEAASFEASRYARGVLWARELDRKGPRAEQAAPLLERHLLLTVKDLQDPEPIVRERAAEELFRLGERGRKTLEATQPRTAEADLLLGLLRHRIRLAVYVKTGEDFSDYARLGPREKRRKIFEYAQTAEEDSWPTLRALIVADDLEPSLSLKLAAAKALASQGDSWGYSFLMAKHPDLLLKRPEVSHELLIIQAYEHIRAKDYQRAVEELQRLLDQVPFHFRANYEIAFAYLLLKSYAKSIHHFEIARRIQPGDQLTLYNLACAYALAGGKQEEALEALEASVRAGFDDAAHIEKDPDLESLRGHPRYQSLLKDLRAKR